jgi:hypothetical protein
MLVTVHNAFGKAVRIETSNVRKVAEYTYGPSQRRLTKITLADKEPLNVTEDAATVNRLLARKQADRKDRAEEVA